jgi:hypothetical protein
VFRQLHQRSMMGLMAALLLLAGCAGSPPAASEPPPQGVTTSQSPLDSGSTGTSTATPDPCTGWSCALEGVVYAGAVGPNHTLAGIPVELSHLSYCSPTRGEHRTTTGAGGTFRFDVFLHDTDRFLIQVARDGYEPVRRSVGGFDCLYCACPALEIVLRPLGSPTAAP